MNYIFRNIILIFQEIRKNIPKTLLASFGIIFLIAFLIISISVKNAVSDYLKKRVFGELKINQIKITPKGPQSSPQALINFSASDIAINDAQVKKIKKIEGLENLEEIIRLNCPASLKAGMLGMYLKTDMLVSGVDKTFFKETIPGWKNFKQSGYIPVVIPMFIMDIYNNFAATNGMPALGPKALNMLAIEMIIGKSSFSRNNKKEFVYKAKIFGYTETITSAGIIVPKDFIESFCSNNSSELQFIDRCYSCIMLIGNARNIDQIPVITKKISSMNLNVESQADIANKTEKALLVLNITFSLIIGIILFLTCISIFNSYLAVSYNRSYIFSIQRMLGASKLRIVCIFILEAGIIGALYGLAGYFAGYYFIIYLKDNIVKWVPLFAGVNLALKPFEYLLVAVGLSTAVSSASAFIPGVFASNLNLFSAMKK